MNRLSAAAVVSCCLAWVACGGGTTSIDPVNDGGAPGSDSGVVGDGGKGDSGPIGPVCPTSVPGSSVPCSTEGVTCEYGDDPRVNCHTLATCTNSKWSTMAPKCAQIPPAQCPASRAAAQGQECTPENAICSYDQGLHCTCTTCPNPYPLCQPLAKPVWACTAPNADADCPPARPNLGTQCTNENKACSYGCEEYNNLRCVNGAWSRDLQHMGGCPVSTRTLKKDIHYLTSSEAETLAGEIDRIKLATYEYTDPALARGRHLGFILEDHATTFAGDADRNQVDLYAYTSTLVAAVQEQSKKIDALEREVKALRARPASKR